MKDLQDKNHSLLDGESDPIVARSKPEISTILQTLDIPGAGRQETIYCVNDTLGDLAVQTSQVSKRVGTPFDGFHLRPNSSRT